MPDIRKILIANRGEIAKRIASTAKKLGIRTVGIYAQADKNPEYFQECDEAFMLEGKSIVETYLSIGQIISLAKKSGCQAIHPGYGFLSENPSFAAACHENSLIFIGPRAEVLELMGNKLAAKKTVEDLGIPVIKGLKGEKNELAKHADELDYPVLIKAAAGGGGKGLRIANDKNEYADQLANAAREAETYFGNPSLYIEQYLEEPRHIEVQILGDSNGIVIHLYHRECSLQRRFQKIIEEAPAVSISEKLSEKILAAAVSIGRHIGYTGAGTVEFLVDKYGKFYFLEMNTRIQVEHPVTEMITGIDIVAQQIRIAEEKPLKLHQEDISITGHAIESRLYAEDATDQFKPSPGKIHYFRAPDTSLARTDTWVKSDTEVLPDYDSLLAKIITHRANRHDALAAHLEALNDIKVIGIETNQLFLQEIIRHPKVRDNKVSTTFIENNLPELIAYKHRKNELIHFALASAVLYLTTPGERSNVWEEIGYWRIMNVVELSCDGKTYHIEYEKAGEKLLISIDGETYEFKVISITGNDIVLETGGYLTNIAMASDPDNSVLFIVVKGHQFRIKKGPEISENVVSGHEKSGILNSKVISPIPGIVSRIYVKNGQKVMKNENLFIIEAMKMDNYIASDFDGVVGKVNVKVGQHITANQVLLEFEKNSGKQL